jgi:hypothetical protein
VGGWCFVEEIVPCGGSTGCVIGARKIRESAELLAKDWQRGDTRTGDKPDAP